jgi:hypothetical protein
MGLFFIVFDNDFKGTSDGASGANKLAHSAPAAIVNFNDCYFIILNLQRAAGTDANAQTTSVALSFVDYRQFRHFTISLQSYCIFTDTKTSVTFLSFRDTGNIF